MRKRMQPIDTFGMVFLTAAVVIAVAKGAWVSIVVGAAFFLIMIGALPHYVALAFLVAASVIILLQRSSRWEGFEDKPTAATTGEKKAEDEPAPVGEEKKVMLPDNADRREMLELGKPYKLPSEKDDKGVHLDAGTTFLNAYKALKPDQIAAMTRDTQELLATQKSLVGMLESFGPLLKDMDKITGFFGNK